MINTEDRRRMFHLVKSIDSRMRDEAEHERRRVSRELHDGVIQLLSVAHFKLEGIRQTEEVAQARRALSRAVDEVRRLSRGLRSDLLLDVGLAQAIRGYCEDFSNLSGASLKLDLQKGIRRYSHDAELGLFRVFQEGFRNVVRHSRASVVRVALRERDGVVELTLRDNGTGFKASECRGLGLLYVQERVKKMGGQLKIHSKVGQGTSLEVRISCKKAMGRTRLRGGST